MAAMRARFAGEGKLSVFYRGQTYYVPCDPDATATIEQMAAFLADYCKANPNTKVDYIHGEGHLLHVAENLDGVGILMLSMPKSALFPYVESHGILPKKAFSLGEAEEKRYYMEAKQIG